MIISHKHKFIFICNGKTGTTSLERALKPYDESIDCNYGAPGLWANKHMPPAVAKAFLPEEVWNTYFKFVFVRHPLDWCVSLWHFNFKKPSYPVKAAIRRPYRAMQFLRDYNQRVDLHNKEILDVADVEYLYEHQKQFRGMPFAESQFQHSYVYDVDGRQIIDFVGRFEAIQDGVQEVRERIGINFELPHVNKTKHRSADSAYTSEGEARVRELWKHDFELFGY